jgi:Domain of unknown function (DUF1707)
MAGDGMMRASDADRDAVVAVLRDAYAAGRLTLEEFGQRTSAAYAGRTWGELRELVADLPEQPLLGADLPTSPTANSPATFINPAVSAAQPDPATPRSPAERPGPPHPGSPPGQPRRRPRPAASVMPFVMIWFLIVIATRSTAAVAAPVVVLALLLLFTAMSRRK